MPRGKFRKRQTLRTKFTRHRQQRYELEMMAHNATLMLAKVRLLKAEIEVHKNYDPDFDFCRNS